MGEPTSPTVAGDSLLVGSPPVGERPDLLVDDHFAVVPEWLLDAPISDCAVRLYAVLLRYGQTSGARMPSRTTLASRLHKGSTDTVDRAMKELVELGAVIVERRRVGNLNQTNRYHVRTRGQVCGGGRTDAATPTKDQQPQSHFVPVRAGTSADAVGGGRRDAARVAADLRPDPEFLTQRKPSPPHLPNDRPGGQSADRLHGLEEQRCAALATQLGLTDAMGIYDLAAELVAARTRAGLPVARWSTRSLVAALQLSVQRGWPADRAVHVLRQLAADPATRSPMRLAEAGPWWDLAPPPGLRRTAQEGAELAELEAVLGEREDRAWLQSRARAHLTATGQPVDRINVARCAARLAESTDTRTPVADAQRRAG